MRRQLPRPSPTPHATPPGRRVVVYEWHGSGRVGGVGGFLLAVALLLALAGFLVLGAITITLALWIACGVVLIGVLRLLLGGARARPRDPSDGAGQGGGRHR